VTNNRDIDQQKAQLRKIMLKRRATLTEAEREKAHSAIAEFAEHLIGLARKPAIFSSYRSHKSELNPMKLEQKLAPLGAGIALPVMVQKAEPLIFRQWRRGDALSPQQWGILEPAPSAPAVQPDVLLLPLLAFDNTGRRLGYGGGFYDRSLQALRAAKPIVAIGLAYAAQEVGAVPCDALDQPLDYALTPDGLKVFTDHRTI